MGLPCLTGRGGPWARQSLPGGPLYSHRGRSCRWDGHRWTAKLADQGLIEPCEAPEGSADRRRYYRITEAALEAVGRWRYAPTMVNGRPVEVLLAVSLRFELQ